MLLDFFFFFRRSIQVLSCECLSLFLNVFQKNSNKKAAVRRCLQDRVPESGQEAICVRLSQSNPTLRKYMLLTHQRNVSCMAAAYSSHHCAFNLFSVMAKRSQWSTSGTAICPKTTSLNRSLLIYYISFSSILVTDDLKMINSACRQFNL